MEHAAAKITILSALSICKEFFCILPRHMAGVRAKLRGQLPVKLDDRGKWRYRTGSELQSSTPLTADVARGTRHITKSLARDAT
jgi:hypothetical protein